MANKSIGVVYNWLHHLIPDSPWEPTKINQPRLERMNKPSQTKFKKGFSLILDDSGHWKSGNFTPGVGRQYIGEMSKKDNGMATVTTHYGWWQKKFP